jgi:hypothetical protein
MDTTYERKARPRLKDSLLGQRKEKRGQREKGSGTFGPGAVTAGGLSRRARREGT